MSGTKIFAIVVIVVGAIMLVFSNYIADRVEQGRMQVRSGQQQVNTINNLFGMSKATKPFGQALTSGAQRRIDMGQAEIAEYEAIAHKLQIGGVVLLIVGAVIFFYHKKRR